MKKYYIRSNSASKKVIPQSIPLLTKFINHLMTTITHLVFLLICPRTLTLLTMQYYDTNLFHEDKNIIKRFAKVNEELRNINDWFMANKFSLKVEKAKYSLLHKPNWKDDFPLKLPKLRIKNQETKRACYKNLLGFFWMIIFH